MQQESLDNYVKIVHTGLINAQLNREIDFMENQVKLSICPECGIVFKNLVRLERNIELLGRLIL